MSKLGKLAVPDFFGNHAEVFERVLAKDHGDWNIPSITPVPEPSSLVPLAGGIGWLVFGLARRFGKKSAIHWHLL